MSMPCKYTPHSSFSSHFLLVHLWLRVENFSLRFSFFFLLHLFITSGASFALVLRRTQSSFGLFALFSSFAFFLSSSPLLFIQLTLICRLFPLTIFKPFRNACI